jgi:tubulin delta
MLTLLDELYPKVPKFVGCVLPHLSGEVILQAYNATLSLGTIYGLADGIFLIENDEMNKVCTDQLNVKKPQLENINRVISRTIASLFFPVINKNTSTLHSLEQNGLNYGRELIEEVFFDNRFKLASIRCAPQCEANYESFNSDSWQSIENQLLLRPKPSRAKLFIGRGMDHPQTNSVQGTRAIYDRHNFYGFNRSACVV